MKRLTFFLVGPGRVGISLGAAWIHSGHRCVGIEGGRASALREARRTLLRGERSSRFGHRGEGFDFLLVATPDREIAATARTWATRVPWRGRAAFHTSGALTSSELEPIRQNGGSVASLHPLTSLAEPTTAVSTFRGVSFGIEGDPLAVRWARILARAAGGRPFDLPPRTKAFYHLCASVSSGYLLALLEKAASDLAASGLDPVGSRRGLLLLAEITLRNARRMGPGRALTGPLFRQDMGTLRAHLRSLRGRAKGWKPLYALLAETALEVALRCGRISPSEARRFQRILRESR